MNVLKHSKLTKLTASVLLMLLMSVCYAKNQKNAVKEEPAAPQTAVPSITVDDSIYEAMNSVQLTKVMGNGINLGNTMEATGATWLGFNNTPSEYEKAWGQPKTTKELFKAYKEAGFDCVRIPVAWMNTMNIAKGDYEISSAYLEYVKQLVDWALEADLIVIVNDHWDYGWWSLFGSGDKELAYKIFDAIWDQVGTYFKDYPYQLIFEAGNEEWGNGFYKEFKIGNKIWCNSTEPNMWSIPENEKQAFRDKAYALITEVAQYFVDKIRAQGSKNSKRFLLIPGYDTDFTLTSDARYIMPSDPVNADICRLMVSVHFYEPSNYAILEESASWAAVAKTWGNEIQVEAQNKKFTLLQRFVDAGYGVIVGEYAVAMLKTNGKYSRKANDTLWLTNILDNCDKYNYCPILWDCNGYFKKTGTLGFSDEDVAAVYKNRSYASEQ